MIMASHQTFPGQLKHLAGQTKFLFIIIGSFSSFHKHCNVVHLMGAGDLYMI